jgi:hypothetical protein
LPAKRFRWQTPSLTQTCLRRLLIPRPVRPIYGKMGPRATRSSRSVTSRDLRQGSAGKRGLPTATFFHVDPVEHDLALGVFPPSSLDINCRSVCLRRAFAVTIRAMKRRGMRLLVLLWLGWYLSEPLFATVDSWDSPQEEMSDIARNAGGAVTLIAAVVCFGIALLRKLRERWKYVAPTLRRPVLPLTCRAFISLPLVAHLATHSPPLPLRI